MIEYNRRHRNYVHHMPPEYMATPDPTWVQGFTAAVAYNNMPFIESVEESALFAHVPFEEGFVAADHISEEYLPYAEDLVRAKNADHLAYLEGRLADALQRKQIMRDAPFTSQLAGGTVGDPLFFLSFVPALNVLKLGKTVTSSAARFGGVGLAYGTASEARRAPFAVGDDPYESVSNIAMETAMGAFLGGGLRFGVNMLPAIRSGIGKARARMRGEEVAHTVDPETGELVYANSRGEYTASFGNPFGSRGQRIMASDEFSDDIKRYFYLLNYNMGVPIEGQKARSLGQSVAAGIQGHVGNAMRLMRSLEDLHAQEVSAFRKGEQCVEKASRILNTHLADFVPLGKRPYNEWFEDTVMKYLQAGQPNPQAVDALMAGVTDQQKKAFTLFKEFFDGFNFDARHFGVIKDDEFIAKAIRDAEAKIETKMNLLRDIEDSIKDYNTKLFDRLTKAYAKKAEFLEGIEVNVRKNGSYSAKQLAAIKKIDDEMADLLKQIDELEGGLKAGTPKQRRKILDLQREISFQTTFASRMHDAFALPTRKNYRFPIFYDKPALNEDEELLASFKQRLADKYFARRMRDNPKMDEGFHREQANNDAAKTVSRILDEDGADLESDFGGKLGGSKYFAHRKTDFDEWEVADVMIKKPEVLLTYAMQMGRKIEFSRAFGGKSPDEVFKDIEALGRAQGLSEVKVAELRKDFVSEYDRAMGLLNRDANRLDQQALRLTKTYAGWTYLGGAGISALSDPATIVLAHGMVDVVRAGKAMLTDGVLRGKILTDAAGANTALDVSMAQAQLRVLNDSLQQHNMTPIEQFMQFGNRLFYTLNALGPITVTFKALDQVLVNDKFIRLSKKLLDKSIDRQDKEYLFRYGIDEDLARYINDMPVQRAEADNFFLANTDEWPRETPQQRAFLRQYQTATAAHADNAVVMAQNFDKPLIMDGVLYLKDNPFFAMMRKQFPNLYAIDERASTAAQKFVRIENQAMTLPFTFMNFAFGANNKILTAVRDPMRKHRLAGVVSLLGLSYLSLEVKDRYWWNSEDETPDMIARLIDHSGITGIYSDLGYMGLSLAAGFADTPEDFFIEPRYVSPNREDRVWDSLTEPFGAPVGLGLSYYRAASDYLAGRYTDANKELFYNAPFLGLPFIRDDMRDLMIGGRR